MKSKLIIAAVGLAVALPASLTLADDAARGKEIVDKKKCSICHAVDGKGGKKDVAPLNGIAKGKTDEWIVKFLAGEEKTSDGKAHSYKGKLTDEEKTAIRDFLKSVSQ